MAKFVSLIAEKEAGRAGREREETSGRRFSDAIILGLNH